MAMEGYLRTSSGSYLTANELEGIQGSEEADRIAKKGAESRFFGPEPAVGISKQTYRQEIRNWLERKQLEA